MRYGALRITIIYVIISLLWITFSDQVLFQFKSQLTPHAYLLISSCKGYLFVIANGYVLYRIINSDDNILVESELQYRTMYENNPNPIWIYDIKTLKFVSVNDAAIARYGYSLNEFMNMTILDIRPSDDAEMAREAAKRVSKNHNQSGTWRHLKKDGSLIYVNITSHRIKFNNEPHIMVMVRDTSERMEFEQQLEKANNDLVAEKRKLTETQLISKVAGWEYILADKKLLWSDELYSITGVKPGDGRDPFAIYVEHVHPEDRPQMIKAFDALITQGQSMDVTHRVTCADGQGKYIRQLARLEYKDGTPYKVTGSMQDITELKLLEQDRNKYQVSFEDTLNNISDAFFALDHNMEIIRINEAFMIMASKSNSSEVIGKHIFDIFPENINTIYPIYKKALTERVIVKKEEYSLALGKWIRLAAYPTDEGVAVYFSDITEHKIKDLQLKEALERYDLVAKATKDVIYDLDILHNRLTYNTSLTQLVNVPFEKIEYSLEWWRSLIHPDDVASVSRSQDRVRGQRKTNWECEYRINCGNGDYRYVMDQGYFIFNEQHEPVRLIGAIRDIDALKRSNEENKRLAGIITKVNNMIIVTDAGKRVTWVNKAFEDFTGYTLDEIAGELPSSFLTGPETSDELVTTIEQKQKNLETFAIDLVNYTKHGEPFWVTAEFTPLYDDKNSLLGYIAVYQNITLRKEKEEEVNRQNAKLREIAWISSHEIRRPVASIMGLMYLMNLTDDLKEREELMAMVNQCTEELDQIVHTINDKINEEVDQPANSQLDPS
jgi:PAS domain S-box-containing protein